MGVRRASAAAAAADDDDAVKWLLQLAAS